MDFSQFNESDGSEELGFTVHWFLDSFNQTFYKSCRKDFECFVKDHSVEKWMIFSDYALYDKSKKNDVITFSLVPYVLEFDKYSNVLKKLAPNDLKSIRKVNSEFIDFLENAPIFTISVVLDRKRKLHIDEVEYHSKRFEMMIAQLEKWCLTTPEGKEHYLELIKKIKVLLQEVRKKGANLKIFRDIDILSSLAAYILFEITKLTKIETIGWFSDRDSLLSYKASKIKSPIIFDIVHHLYFLFCNSENIDSKNKLVLGVPESNDEGSVWYDPFNRVPDLFAGTLADYDIKNNKCSHEKFIPVIERLFTLSQKNLFFNTKFSPEGYSVSRFDWSAEEEKC
ncbi:hypothetical protein PSECIP111854_00453 [Pseudoalteromonas sp. CIP111854]|uniref:Uncharacterized protein n=1 Tax=Pseudoalteromonas holothuriae TaxID=2963714 RepID=A0A9W4VLT2_9GAMM|nr:hypothetical protein [Pseudoalteromonas sp. CIP111854]CAH9050034.1 hypothetical protein PSECIP111854_00453 [Pseudoalteromonas sp. CIP111854]